jgi:hypothetical protein
MDFGAGNPRSLRVLCALGVLGDLCGRSFGSVVVSAISGEGLFPPHLLFLSPVASFPPSLAGRGEGRVMEGVRRSPSHLPPSPCLAPRGGEGLRVRG